MPAFFAGVKWLVKRMEEPSGTGFRNPQIGTREDIGIKSGMQNGQGFFSLPVGSVPVPRFCHDSASVTIGAVRNRKREPMKRICSLHLMGMQMESPKQSPASETGSRLHEECFASNAIGLGKPLDALRSARRCSPLHRGLQASSGVLRYLDRILPVSPERPRGYFTRLRKLSMVAA